MIKSVSSYLACIIALVAVLPTTSAVASEHVIEVIEGIEIINDGTNDKVIVTGQFAPALPCDNEHQGFILYSADPYFKEIYQMLLSAKILGTSVSFTFVYCPTNSYARGNHFKLQ